jgi:glycosyltransferase involved in cell wall biosynthesis
MSGITLSDLRAMALSSDLSLASSPGDAVGDTLKRQCLYAQHVRRYDVVVRSDQGKAPMHYAGSPSLNVHTVPSSRAGFVAAGYARALRIARAVGTQAVSCQDPITMGLIGYLLKRRLGLGLNLQINGDIVDNPYWLAENRLYPTFNRLARWLIPRADTVRVSTSREREKYVQTWGIPEERVWNVPFLVDFAPYLGPRNLVARRDLEIDDDVPMALFLGRLVRAKNLDVLFEAIPAVLRIHPRTVFVLAGAGPESDTLRKLAAGKRVEANIRIPGRIAHSDVPALYAAADLFVLCSQYEGTSMVTLEAAAAGLPIVTTDVTGAFDSVVPDESGVIVPKRNPPALASAISGLLDDSERARRMGARGREHVLATFDPDRIARKMAEMWLATARLAR